MRKVTALDLESSFQAVAQEGGYHLFLENLELVVRCCEDLGRELFAYAPEAVGLHVPFCTRLV